MYICVFRCRIIPSYNAKIWDNPVLAPQHIFRASLLLARRQTLVSPHPQEQSGFGVANGPAELNVGRAVAAHARLGQPR